MAIGFDLLGPALGAGLFEPSTADLAERTTGPRFIDPVTGDYLLDETGQFARMPSLRQRVLIALRQVRDSGPAGLGIELPDRIDERFESRMRDRVTTALAHLTAKPNPAMVNLSVTVEDVGGGRARTLVTYDDATTGRSEGVQF